MIIEIITLKKEIEKYLSQMLCDTFLLVLHHFWKITYFNWQFDIVLLVQVIFIYLRLKIALKKNHKTYILTSLVKHHNIPVWLNYIIIIFVLHINLSQVKWKQADNIYISSFVIL